MTNELTPYIEYYSKGNVLVKGQLNSKGQREGLWECFSVNGNIYWRASYIEGMKDGIEEWFDEQGNIQIRTPYKGGKRDGIEDEFDEQVIITVTRVWKDGELIVETEN
jgi:antitoxin component YwqK of YwqJK toxin-antitoxin module